MISVAVACTSFSRRSRLPLTVSRSSAVGSTQTRSGSSSAAFSPCRTATSGMAPSGRASTVPSNSRVNVSAVAGTASSSGGSPGCGVARGGRGSSGRSSSWGAAGGGMKPNGAAVPVRLTAGSRPFLTGFRAPVAELAEVWLASQPRTAASRGAIRSSIASTSPAQTRTSIRAAVAAPPSRSAKPALKCWPIDPALPEKISPKKPSMAITTRMLPAAARAPPVQARWPSRRAPVTISPPAITQAPMPSDPSIASCTGRAREPPSGRARTTPSSTPRPTSPMPLSSRRWSALISGLRGVRAGFPSRRPVGRRLVGRRGAVRAGLVRGRVWVRGGMSVSEPRVVTRGGRRAASIVAGRGRLRMGVREVRSGPRVAHPGARPGLLTGSSAGAYHPVTCPSVPPPLRPPTRRSGSARPPVAGGGDCSAQPRPRPWPSRRSRAPPAARPLHPLNRSRQAPPARRHRPRRRGRSAPAACSPPLSRRSTAPGASSWRSRGTTTYCPNGVGSTGARSSSRAAVRPSPRSRGPATVSTR